jgi:light-regulated signal transduction histidine kinase (bacteriophytochrome)
MGQLIDDLLDFSRIGRKQLTPSMVRMQFLVSDVCHDALEHDASLQNCFDIKPLAEVTGDLSMLKQVWINLISNAIKYSKKSENREIQIGNFSEDLREVYYVKDNGIGFEMQYSDKLFQVFQRLHSQTEFEGTGVGLAIVHRIITKHDGSVWAEAEPDKGATFFFSLPKK